MKAIRPEKRILSTNVLTAWFLQSGGARIRGRGEADDLKRGPRFHRHFLSEHFELRLAQRNCHVVSVPIVTMEEHQQFFRGGVVDLSQGADDRGNIGCNERSCERRESPVAGGACAERAARAEHDQACALESRELLQQLLRGQLARFLSMRREQEPRLPRVLRNRDSVTGEMNDRRVLCFGKKSLYGRIGADEHRCARVIVARQFLHFLFGVWNRRKSLERGLGREERGRLPLRRQLTIACECI